MNRAQDTSAAPRRFYSGSPGSYTPPCQLSVGIRLGGGWPESHTNNGHAPTRNEADDSWRPSACDGTSTVCSRKRRTRLPPPTGYWPVDAHTRFSRWTPRTRMRRRTWPPPTGPPLKLSTHHLHVGWWIAPARLLQIPTLNLRLSA